MRTKADRQASVKEGPTGQEPAGQGSGKEGSANREFGGRTFVTEVMQFYPRIFLACHTRHVMDSQTGQELSDHQASVLDHLDEVEPTSLAELAKHMGVTPSTMSIAVDRLVRSGHVSRERTDRDGRRVSIRLTESGARIRKEKSVLDPRLVASMLGHLTEEEQKEAVTGLGLLARASMELMETRSDRSLVKRRPLPEQ
ncbi:MAG TPA: MarR family winged helix-turn-helix transcriptional regulator [Blastocatellia bacterium]|nr:MarR family winged helix-turn-helix transcriptional regulator [Blastocatellia bacterium]